jgi:dynein heavy chain
MPVINCKAVPADKLEEKGVYKCPVYKTEQRGPTYVFLAQLKTKAAPARWVMAGVALLLDVVG